MAPELRSNGLHPIFCELECAVVRIAPLGSRCCLKIIATDLHIIDPGFFSNPLLVPTSPIPCCRQVYWPFRHGAHVVAACRALRHQCKCIGLIPMTSRGLSGYA